MSGLRALAQLLPWIVGSVVLAVGALWIVRYYVPIEALRPSNDVIGNYLQTLGGIYAVLLAFVVYAVWQQFNESRLQVEREASEITELFRITQKLPEAARSRVQARLWDYVCGVLGGEWTAMAQRNGKQEFAAGLSVLDAIWDELSDIELACGWDNIIATESMTCFNELCSARTARIAAARLRLPRPLRLLLYVGAFVLVSSTWLFAVDSFAVHAFVTGATAGVTSHLLAVIEDLDDGFSGSWQVPRSAFLTAQEFMRSRAPTT